MPNTYARGTAKREEKTSRPHGFDAPDSYIGWVLYENKTERARFDLSYLKSLFGDYAKIVRILILDKFSRLARKSVSGIEESINSFCKYKKAKFPNLAPITGPTFNAGEAANWQTVTDSWANTIMTRKGSPRAHAEKLSGFNRMMHYLSAASVIPKMTLQTGAKNRHKQSTARPLLAQQVKVKKGDIPKEVHDVIQATVDASLPEDDADNRKILTDMLLSIAAGISSTEALSPEKVQEKLKNHAENCMRKIQEIASKKYRNWEAIYVEGQELMENGHTATAESIAKAFRGDSSSILYVSSLIESSAKSLVPHGLLAFELHFGGIPPSETEADINATFARKFYAKVCKKSHADAMLFPTPDAVASTTLLLASETPLNIAVIISIDLPLGMQPIPDNDDAVVVSSIKKRANCKNVPAIIQKLRSDGLTSAYHAMKMLESAGRPLRMRFNANLKAANERAGNHLNEVVTIDFEKKKSKEKIALDAALLDGTAGKLFISKFFSQPELMTDINLRNRLRYFLRDEKISDEYMFTPSAIRPCVLMLAGMSSSPDSQIIANMASHGEDSNATSAYAFRVAQRLRAFAHMRQFQEGVASLMKNREPVASADSDDAVSDRSCTHIVNLSEELMLDAQLTIECLTRSNDLLVETRRQHWIYRCEPELAWATVVMEKSEKSSWAKFITRVKRTAKEALAAGYIHPLEI